jgi:MFS family permease
MLLTDALKGNQLLLAKRMGQISAGVGVLELFLNPIAGQLSDRSGRRLLLVLSPFINCFNKMLVAVNPTFWTIAWERVVDGAVTTLAGSTTCAAGALCLVVAGRSSIPHPRRSTVSARS